MEIEEYIIEKILKKRKTVKDKIEYLVKWEGYDELTWEPEANFAKALDLIQEFDIQQLGDKRLKPKQELI